LNVGMLAMGLKQRGLLGFDPRLARILPRILLATAMMAAALYVIEIPFAGWWSADMARRGIGLLVLVGGGLAVYGAVIVLSGAAKVSDVTGLFKRERSSALTEPKGATDNPIPPETLSSST